MTTPAAQETASLPPGPARFSPRDWVQWIVRPVSFLDRARRRWGDDFTLPNVPGRPMLVWLSDTDALRDVFAADAATLHAGEANFIVEGVLGDKSLLMLDGESHRRSRKLMMPPFHGERMRAYGQTMRAITSAAIARWPMNEEFELQAEMQAITLDVILRTVFGLDEGPQMERLRALLRESLARVSSPVIFGASLFVGSARLRDLIAAASRPRPLFGRFSINFAPLVPGHRAFVVLSEADELLRAEFHRRRAQGDVAERQDVLSMLLAARDESGAQLDDDELRDEMMTLLIAGHETTATSLAWAFHHLLANPEPMRRLRAELAPLAARGDVEPDAVANLEYLDAVVKETMRLTPVVPLVARVAKRDFTAGRYRIPAGAMIMPSIYVTHHRADLYPEPERFRPERFLERKPGPNEFFPFGGGLRRCLGAAFATYEMKLVLAEIVTRTTLEPRGPDVKPETMIVRRGIMFAPSNGTRVALRARY